VADVSPDAEKQQPWKSPDSIAQIQEESAWDATSLAKERAAMRASQQGAHDRGVHYKFAALTNENFGALLGLNVTEQQGDAEHEPFLASRLVAEFVGTFFLVFAVGVSTQSASSPLAAAAIGLILSIQIYTFGAVSGGMFNPAVTVAVLLSGRDKIIPKHAAMYIGSQFLGGWIAGLFAFSASSSSFCFDWQANSLSNGVGVSLVLEMFYTAALCGTVLATGTSFDVPNDYFGFAIGLTVMASAFACGSLDQGSFNPAVTFGISFANSINSENTMTCDAGSWFTFLLVPFIGAALAAGVFRVVRHNEYTPQDEDILLHEKLIAEFTGTFFLVLTVGVATQSGTDYAAIAIGVMLAVQIYTFGTISGACFNPAVTLAVFLSGRAKIELKDAAAYVSVQLLAGVVAALIAYGVTDNTLYFDYELTPSGGAGSSFLLEAFCTCALCLTVLTTGTSKDAPNSYFGFAIGLTVTASAITCGDFDQGSFNPAVTLGMNMANYANGSNAGTPSGGAWMLFLFAPFIGSVLAVGIFMGTRLKEYQDSSGNIYIVGNIDPKKGYDSTQEVGKPNDKE
jgi:aquaporin Z